jgi:ABC-type multidrug transport system ATPase subunit
VVISNQAILQARGLTFQFSQKQVFNDFSVSICSGITYITGDESAGKTTLLRLLAGDLVADAGDIQIHGISLKNDLNDLDNYQKQVFWTAPRTLAFDQLTANDFFDLKRQFYPRFDESVLRDTLIHLSLTEHVDKAIYMLSAGSKRKVWLAAAFACGAEVTLIDEPFAALDTASINSLLSLLKKYVQDVVSSPRAWVIADYEPPRTLLTPTIINLDK